MLTSDGRSGGPASLPQTVLAPADGFRALGELWTSRRLVSLLVRFEARRRYRSPLGRAALTVAQPLLVTAVAVVVFGPGRFSPEGIPYAVYVFSGFLVWQLVQSALVGPDGILGSAERFIPRVHFPSVAVPVAAVGASLLDIAAALLVLVLMVAYYGVPLAGPLWTLPLWVLGAVLTALGVALWLLPLRVRHAGVRSAVPFLSLIWLLTTPVFWASTILPEARHPLLGLNPMFSVVHGFRWALFGSTTKPPVLALVASAGVIAVMLLTGWRYCRRDHLGDLLEFRVVRPGPRE